MRVFIQRCFLLDRLSSITFQSASDFRLYFFLLTSEGRSKVYAASKEQLPLLIKDGFDFEAVFYYLTPEQTAEVYHEFKKHLPAILCRAFDFQSFLQPLTIEQRTKIYEDFSDHLPSMIHNAHDFKFVFSSITFKERAELYEKIKKRLPLLMKTPSDCELIFSYLPPEKSKDFSEFLRRRAEILSEIERVRLKFVFHSNKLKGKIPLNFREKLINLFFKRITKEKISIEQQAIAGLNEIKNDIQNGFSYSSEMERHIEGLKKIFEENEILSKPRSCLFFNFNGIRSLQIAREGSELLKELVRFKR